MIAVLFYIIFIVLYMIGGQYKKQFRRIVAPLTTVFYTLIHEKQRSGKWKFKYCTYLLLMFLLSMGYGEDSKLHGLCQKKDWLTRICYGLILSIPFCIINVSLWWAYILILPVCYSVRAGSLGKVGKFDILTEDIVRAVGLCSCIQVCLI